MMQRMRSRLLGFLIAFTAAVLCPLVALAQDQPKTIAPYDGRLEGYGKEVTLDGGSTALTWLLLIFLGVVCLGVLFKNARRSHLD
jgi:hypothetical protein